MIVSNTLFLDSVDFHPFSHEPYESIMLDIMCRFRVDAGADVTAIPHELFTSTYACELKPVHEV